LECPSRRDEKGYVNFANYRFRKLQIIISQTTDFHFANYRFAFRKLQIFISQTTDFHFVSSHFISFHFVSSHFVSQTTVSRSIVYYQLVESLFDDADVAGWLFCCIQSIFLVMDTRGLETTIVRTQNMHICHWLCHSDVNKSMCQRQSN